MSATSLMLLGFERLFRQCLVQALNENAEIRVIDAKGEECLALAKIGSLQPDVVIVNFRTWGEAGFGLIGDLLVRLPELKVVAYGLPANRESMLRCVEAGAHGLLSEASTLEDFEETVKQARQGEMASTPEVSYWMFRRLSELAHLRREMGVHDSMVLTSRELEILRLIANGLANQEIAERLCLSFHTVKNHIQNIFKKIDVKRRTEAVEHARRRGWLEGRH